MSEPTGGANANDDASGAIPRRRQLSLEEYDAGLLACDRAVLGRALSLIESRNPEHEMLARQLLERIHPRTGNALRIGISGVPGVGKSTFIEALGTLLTESGLGSDPRTVAVLAVDPSSQVSGGSILGDKTRMTELSANPRAFVRPSPSSGALGGVGHRTRECVLLCEAAGFDTVLVETVGVGQSETAVAELVDLFLVLMLPGAGDELQGIKRGILELVDVIAINKADGEHRELAETAQKQYRAALHILRGHQDREPPVVLVSSLERTGFQKLWETIEAQFRELREAGVLDERRAEQRVRWLWGLVEAQWRASLRSRVEPARITELENRVRDGSLLAPAAAAELLEAPRE